MNAFMFAIDSIITQFRKFLLSVVLVFICLLLVLFAIMAYHGQNMVYESCDKVLYRGVSNTGIVQLMENGFHSDNMKEYIDALSSREEIQAIGDCGEFYLTDLSVVGLQEIQEKYIGKTEGEIAGLKIQFLNANAVSLCEFHLSEGKKIEELSFDKEKICYLYLGAGYAGIPVGTTYSLENETYIVAGILETGQEWIKEEMLFNFSGEVGNAAMDCTYEIFGISKQAPREDYLWISSTEGHSIEEVFMAAEEEAVKYNIEIHYGSLQEKYELAQADTVVLLSYLSKIIGIVAITTVLMLVSLQIVFVLINLREYGIMYAIGFSKEDIFCSVLCRNIIISIMSFLLVVPCLFWIARKWFSNCGLSYIIRKIFLPYMLPAGMGILVFVIAIVSVVTNILLKKFTPVYMIQSK